MSAEIVQFVPGLKPDEFLTPLTVSHWTEEELKLIKAGKRPVPYDDRPDTAPSEYVAPDGDCA